MRPPPRESNLQLELAGVGDDQALHALVEVFSRAGVRRIEGDLVGDDGWMKGVRYGSGWMWEDLEHGYGSPLSGYVTSQAGEHLAFSILLNRYQPAETDPTATEELDVLVLRVAELAVRSDEPWWGAPGRGGKEAPNASRATFVGMV